MLPSLAGYRGIIPGDGVGPDPDLWTHLPTAAGDRATFDDITYSPRDLLPPRDAGTYQYSGSLTTPPCTERVTWMVLATPLRLGNDVTTVSPTVGFHDA